MEDTRTRAIPRRGLWALASVGVGIVAATAVPSVASLHWLLIAAAGIVCVASCRGRFCALAMLISLGASAASWCSLRTHERLPFAIERILASPGVTFDPVASHDTNPVASEESPRTLVRVRAEIIRPPQPAHPPRGALAGFAVRPHSSVMDVRLRAILSPGGEIPADGRLWVRVTGQTPPTVRAGDQVTLTGTWSPVRPALNPGGRDRRLLAAHDHRVGWLALPGWSLVQPIPHDSPQAELRAWTMRVIDGLRQRARRVLSGEGRGASLCRAMLLGEADADLRDTQDAFMRLGLAHLLAISGFHLTVMAGAALMAIRLTGDRGRFESLAVAAIVGIYLLVVPAETPVVRAGVMVLVLLLSRAAGRRYDDLNILAWVAVGLLVWRPLDLFSLGFQLSVGLTATLIWLAPRVEMALLGPPEHRIAPPTHVKRFARWLARPVIAATICWLVALPAIVYFTGRISLLGIAATVLVGPAAVLVLAGGYASLMLGMLVPGLEGAMQYTLALLGGWLAAFVHLLDGIPGTVVHVPRVSTWWGLGATVALVFWLASGRIRNPRWAVLPALVAVWATFDISRCSLARGVELRLDALAVGEGTCMLIRSGNDAMLWDCGGGWPGAGVVEIPRAIRALGASRVRTVIITHPHFDHYCSLLDVVEPLGVRRVLVSEWFLEAADARANGPEAALRQGLESRGVRLELIAAGSKLSLGVATLDVLAPERGWRARHVNDRSLMARLHAPSGLSVLLTGDAQAEAFGRLEGLDLRADVLELPHHGAAVEASRDLVAQVNPRVVVQSAGDRRTPDAYWLDLARDRIWSVTARDGACWVELLADGRLRAGSVRASSKR
ncbi:MAG: ComEC/Rec2 family competence protein [Phycisphaeraceae bacterium]|nr:ComEC/Rec2 family competence protein [Phycisphaeraceae bacterium]